ncbi:hypothetical protein BDY21DRAFT_385311 [Lineolata rhizophorae]|uniref:C2H2-type domain-containing protein n=1 Tax=Lineolata rhizophorae TaxID=578093 RepID=A0A6A6P2X4_9PEZI|nr:hypothetical protein BDY21DRAFT_385311 [Lineolata rhizophorae]
MDSLEDMELDDHEPPTPQQQQYPNQQGGGAGGASGSMFDQTSQQPGQRMTPLNVNVSAAMQHQGLRTSTPTTPSAGHQTLSQNPMVSSVNTPTLNAQPLQTTVSGQRDPTSAGAGMDQDMSGMHGLSMDMGDQMMQDSGGPGGAGRWNMDMGTSGDMANLTIDEPGRRLFANSKTAPTQRQGGGAGGGARAGGAGNLTHQQQLQQAIQSGQLPGNDQDLARRLQLQQMHNAALAMGGFQQEVKPFRCPVIGCEKAYKNQNGLKYHKQHGHQNQQLKENEDGTFSIVDPVTSIPYPGTVGMEKEKPYRCDVCGKRYKNLNGLKYHRQHSPPCNPDLKLNPANINVAGAGLLDLQDTPGVF